MDFQTALSKGDKYNIEVAINNLTLEEIQRQLVSWNTRGKSVSVEVALHVLDCMERRFNYLNNEYPFLIACYSLNIPERFDRYVLPETDPWIVTNMRNTIMSFH